MDGKLPIVVVPQIPHQQSDLQNLMKAFNMPPPLPKKIQQKKQFILMKLPLFMTIYQKKGEQNFSLIVDSIRLKKFQYGEVILSSEQLNESDDDVDSEEPQIQRTFNYILKGTVMMFTFKDYNQFKTPEFFKKLGPNEHFGEKLSFGHDKLYQVKALSTCYILQLDINIFYNTFAGHFQYAELKDKTTFLHQIWIFSQLRRSIIQKILLLSENVKYKKNTILFKKNDIPDKFYVIVAGELALYQRQQNEKVKFVPFCLLGRSQICGLEEIALEKNYEYNGVVTSQFLQVMIISKQIYEDCLVDYVSKKRKEIEKIMQQKLKLKDLGIKYDKYYKGAVQQSKKKQDEIFKVFANAFLKKQKNTKIQVEKVELNHVQELKNRHMRQIRLKEIRETQCREFNNSSLSKLTNRNYTKDKNILINYLMKKEKDRRKASEQEFKYQRSLSAQVGLLKPINIESSSAVKHHKRKLLKSRYRSVPTLIRQ